MKISLTKCSDKMVTLSPSRTCPENPWMYSSGNRHAVVISDLPSSGTLPYCNPPSLLHDLHPFSNCRAPPPPPHVQSGLLGPWVHGSTGLFGPWDHGSIFFILLICPNPFTLDTMLFWLALLSSFLSKTQLQNSCVKSIIWISLWKKWDFDGLGPD